MKNLIAIIAVLLLLPCVAIADNPKVECKDGVCRILPRNWGVVEQPTPAPVESKPAEVIEQTKPMQSVLIRTVQPIRNVASYCSECKPIRGVVPRLFRRGR